MREIDQQSQGVGKAGTGLRRVAPAEPVQLTPTPRRVRLFARTAANDLEWVGYDLGEGDTARDHGQRRIRRLSTHAGAPSSGGQTITSGG